MKGVAAAVALLACAATPACRAVADGASDEAPSSRVYVTTRASSLVQQGVAETAPAGADASAFEQVPPPGVQFRPNVARATNVPWIDSNGWRFRRGLERASYRALPPGAAPLAAAEAFAYGVDAILDPDPADVEELGRMLRFLKAHARPRMPEMVNIAVVDDRSPAMGEILNMLTRRNLLYRVVTTPGPRVDLTVQLGTPGFPTEAAANPYEFAARVRSKLGDDRRLVRLYGTSTVIAHLTGDDARARLYLLAYGERNRRQRRGDPQAIRVRLLGRYQPVGFAAYGAADEARLTDLRHPGKTTEFWVPDFDVCAIVDLDAQQ
ncbi:MAG: hypothetical protein ACRD2X_07725 [Vicinamibacteraceae bacterium]